MRENKKILLVDLALREASLQVIPELNPFIGGVAMGVKIYSLFKNMDPLVICVGPLNGYFPFVSKTCFVVQSEGVIEDMYLGGSLSFRIAYSGVDAIVLANMCDSPTFLDIVDEEVRFFYAKDLGPNLDVSNFGLPGRRSILLNYEGSLLLDGYFTMSLDIVGKKFLFKNLAGICFTGNKNYDIKDVRKYSDLFTQILSRAKDLTVDFGNNPSCSGCPLGCSESKFGEVGGNILLHSLVACGYAENIYSNVGVVFSCLDVLGYKYTHEHIESLPDLFTKTMKEIEENV